MSLKIDNTFEETPQDKERELARLHAEADAARELALLIMDSPAIAADRRLRNRIEKFAPSHALELAKELTA